MPVSGFAQTCVSKKIRDPAINQTKEFLPKCVKWYTDMGKINCTVHFVPWTPYILKHARARVLYSSIIRPDSGWKTTPRISKTWKDTLRAKQRITICFMQSFHNITYFSTFFHIFGLIQFQYTVFSGHC